ncbi:hypothetical protein Tco_0161614 [Tanacetum coccineum]
MATIVTMAQMFTGTHPKALRSTSKVFPKRMLKIYVKGNDAVLKNVQESRSKLQNQMAKLRRPTRSGKTLEEPSIPLVPTPVTSIPQKEPEQNPETSTEKVQNLNLENTAHVPPPGEENSIFIEIPKPKAKKTVNLDRKFSQIHIHTKLSYPERKKVRENDKPSAQHMPVGKEELVYYADKSEKNKNKHCAHAISVIDFSKDDPFSGSTTTHSDDPSPSSSPVKTSDNFEKFADELAPLDVHYRAR